MNSREKLAVVINDMTEREAQTALDIQNRLNTTCSGMTIAKALEEHIDKIAAGIKRDPYAKQEDE